MPPPPGRLLVLVSVVMVVGATGGTGLAGAIASSDHVGQVANQPVPTSPPETDTTETVPPDPPDDVLGWESGYWYNESISVNQSDGLTAVETEAFVSRAMARVEYLRGLEFKEDVQVEVISRQEYVDRTTGGENDTVAPQPTNASEATRRYGEWNNQVWEGLFIVGEDTDVNEEFAETSAGTVAGFYNSATDRLVIVSDDPESLTIDPVTLIHELVHAVQDQHFDLTQRKYHGITQDEDLALGGLKEGDASFIESLYLHHCQLVWDCVGTPTATNDSAGDRSPEVNLGILVIILNQYTDGEAFVHQTVSQQGWDALDALYDDPPESTEQIIHVDPDEDPVAIEYEDRATGGWERYETIGENGSDTVGEASIFTMFWYQGVEYDISLVNTSAFFAPEQGEFDTYNYTSPPSTGWANDRLFPYTNGDEFGYVWTTEWDTETDAEQFNETYVSMIRGHGGTQVGDDVWVIEEGPFADAFHVDHHGTTVTIVNGPTVEDVADIRPSIGGGDGNETSGA